MNATPTVELDQLLTKLIQTAEGISDLLFVAGKPPQAEVHGRLAPPANSAEPPLTSPRIEGLAHAIIAGNQRLIHDLAGPCYAGSSWRDHRYGGHCRRLGT